MLMQDMCAKQLVSENITVFMRAFHDIHVLDIFWIYPPATVADRGLGWDFRTFQCTVIQAVTGIQGLGVRSNNNLSQVINQYLDPPNGW